MENFLTNMKRFSPVVLRIGMALVFLWFGASQISDPASWTAFVPDYAMSLSGLSVATLVHINGIFEIVFGSMLLFGFFTRFAALLLALHMIDITFIVGLDAIGIRDFGLSIASIAILLNGPDWFSLDRFKREQPASKAPVSNRE